MTGRRPLMLGLALAGVGLLLFVLGLLVDPRQALGSYLAAYAAGTSIALGALILVMTCNLTGARWFVPFRPAAEAVAASGPLLAVLFVPIALGLRRLYPWATGATGNRAWLDPVFFVVRAALYLAVWIVAGLLLRRWSSGRSGQAPERPDGRSRALSAAGLPAVGFTLSFAAFDWLMSLAPTWISTVYGVYVFAGGFLGALALLAVLQSRARAAAAGDLHSLGNLLLTFTAFWAYIAFSQLFIIWIADVPAEVAWYVPRLGGSWGWLALAVLAGQFALPFLALLLRSVKRSAVALAAIGVWLLVFHYLDVYWLVQPEVHPSGIHPHWLDLAALCLVGGTGTAYVGRLLGRAAPVSASDRAMTRRHPQRGGGRLAGAERR